MMIRNCVILKNRLPFNKRFLSTLQNAVPKCPHQQETQTISWENAKPLSEIPGPKKYPIVGILPNFLPGGKFYNFSVIEMYRKLRETFGPIVSFPGLLGAKPVVFVFDPKDFETVYRTEGTWPERIGFDCFKYFRKNVRPDVFKGIGGLIADEGETWQYSRTKCNPVMLQPKTVKTYMQPVDEVVRDFMERIKSIRDNKNEVPADFQNEMNKWALETVGVIALDTRLGVLGDIPKDSDAQKLIQCVHDLFQLEYELDALPSIWRYYKTPKFNQMMKTLNTMTDLILKYIDLAIARIENEDKLGVDKSGREQSILEKLLKDDRQVAIVMALDSLMAGVDTTSNSSIATLYHLAKNPDKQDKLRKEILTVLPNKDSQFTEENMKSMPYLRACIKEAMRINPVVAGGIRTAGQNLVLQGYQIPKGQDVAMANMLLQNDEKYFEKASEFIPERWLKVPDAEINITPAKSTSGFVYLPFGFGARTCIGRRLADLEMETFISRMIRNFQIDWNYPDMKFASKIINTPVGDMKFRFTDI